ncbi:restriction endonuclease subunit S [Clostridium beijerinckii]|uniref:restriction endonuclease subunit S n=1 Tax=Clostridium beijerinckii TaxID=1520 RepID=UPI0003D2C119|nr:restriction endonuclease subunit S [Clostridium beijerinckii]AQS18296.2 hypothetical protein X276_27120 [Clostridium beijerinckii NRRL B-598]
MAKKNWTLEEKLEEAVVKDGPYEVPGNWVSVKLNSIFSFEKGKKPKTLIEEYVKNCIPYVNISYFETRVAQQYTFTTDTNRICNEDDILIVWDGARAGLIGTGVSGAIGSTLCKIKSNGLNNKFVYYYFLSNYDNINLNTKGTGIPHVDPSYLGTLSIGIPPLKEQQKIVDRIESLFEKLDKAKELIEEAREGFEKRKSAVLEKAFRGELTEKWRRENRNLDKMENLIELIKEERYSMIKTNREKKELDLTFDSHNYDYEYVPNQWIKVKASMICDTITSGKTPKNGVSDSGDIPFLKVYNIVDNNISFSYRPQFISEEIHNGAMKSSNLIEKDIVMNIVGPPLRKVAIITDEYAEWNMNQNMVRFRPIKFVDYKYLYYCLLREETLNKAIDESKGVVGQIIISTVKCRNLEIPIPSLVEQKEIVRILDNTYNKDITIDELTNLEERIESIKKAILAKAFRGELGTNCEEDESALGMLKEILSKQ